MSRLTAAPSEPLYRALEQVILQKVRDGSLPPGSRLDSPEKLARELDSSPSTVRLALQSLALRKILVRIPRRGTVVSKDALKVLEREHEQEPSMTTATRNFGLLVPDIRIPEYAALAGAVLDVAHETETNISVFSTEDDNERYDSSIRRCIQSRFSGLIMVPPLYSQLPLSTLSTLEQSKMPVVTCWRGVEVMGWPVVRTDPADTMSTTTTHLIQSGCRQIAFLAFDAAPHDFNRLSGMHGFTRTLNLHGLQYSDDMVFSSPTIVTLSADMTSNEQSIMNRLVDWLKLRPQIDGLACQHDVLAIMATRALRMLGRRVPDDVMVTGVGNNTAYATLASKPLTTYDSDIAAFGRKLCELLDQLLNGQVFPRNSHFVIPGRLVVRESTIRNRQ